MKPKHILDMSDGELFLYSFLCFFVGPILFAVLLVMMSRWFG